MFLREIANAEIKKKYYFSFIINKILTSCFPESCKRCFLPKEYVPIQDCGGELMRKIMDFPL